MEQDRDYSKWFVEEILPHEEDVRSWLRNRYPTVSDVDDILQEAYRKLLKANASGPIVNPRAFLFVTVRNLVLNCIRHQNYVRPQGSKVIELMKVRDELEDPYRETVKSEEIRILTDAISSLPNRCRQIITLRKIYGYSQKEVAKKLGISVKTVEQQGIIGLKKCVQYFKQYGYSRKGKHEQG